MCAAQVAAGKAEWLQISELESDAVLTHRFGVDEGYKPVRCGKRKRKASEAWGQPVLVSGTIIACAGAPD